MQPVSRYLAFAAALGLHVTVIVAMVTGLSEKPGKAAVPVPVTIALLPASMPLQSGVAPSKSEPASRTPAPRPAESVPKTHNKKSSPAPKTPSGAAAPVHEPPAPPVVAAPHPPASDPATAAATSSPAASAPSAPAPAVKTGVSISASYAASNRKPRYPRLSRINDEQGTVVLRVLVRADGHAGKVEIKSSSGYPLLDESATSAVQSWRFRPATVDGKPLDEWYQLAIPFTLRDD